VIDVNAITLKAETKGFCYLEEDVHIVVNPSESLRSGTICKD
jgi:hypothetical protein